MTEPRGSAGRALEGVRSARSTLRTIPAGSADGRYAFLQLADAAEDTLRRLLRDHESAPVHLRLRALAPDEMSPESVVSELRQLDRISIELAAAFHDLLRVRHRLKGGGEIVDTDVEIALQVADRLEHEALALPPTAPPHPPLVEADISAAERAAPGLVAEPDTEVVKSRSFWPWAAGGVLALLLAGALWVGLGETGGEDAELEEGITLFRSGELADAVPLFRTYAEANPADPLPRLYLARIYRRARRFEAATSALREALAIAPNDPALHRELGFLLLDVGKHEAAQRRFRSAIELEPDDPLAWMGLIRALREAGREDAAARILAQAPAEVRALLQQQDP